MKPNLITIKKIVDEYTSAFTLTAGGVVGATVASVLNHKKKVRKPINLEFHINEVEAITREGGGFVTYETPAGTINVWLTGLPK